MTKINGSKKATINPCMILQTYQAINISNKSNFALLCSQRKGVFMYGRDPGGSPQLFLPPYYCFRHGKIDNDAVLS